MKKTICLLAILLICNLLAIPASAASEEPVITLHPQSPNYPENSVAIYTVKANGTNLQTTWYMDWLGETYTISNLGENTQAWEGFAGSSYGPRKLDENTFAYIFEGIQYDLDGAYIWCVIEDGHYSVTSQKNRISVDNTSMPPEIVSIPSELTVEQGDLAEIRCVAKSPNESQLSFLWYETDTGKREDIRAVNRGEETSDLLICDTEVLGTRNYVCLVETSDGGMSYSSIVPVTVIEKQTITADPDNSHQPPEGSATASDQLGSPTDETTDGGTTDSEPATLPQTSSSKGQSSGKGLPWWATVLIATAAAGLGFGIAVVIVRKKA